MLYFHESSVLTMDFHIGLFNISISDVMNQHSEKVKINYKIDNAICKIDGVLIENFEIDKGANGEVLSLEASASSMSILIEWHYYPGSKTVCQKIEVKGNVWSIEN